MLVTQSTHPLWLSNSYLLADPVSRQALIIDTGGPSEPILQTVAEADLRVTHVLCTHHHGDHVAGNELYRSRLGCRLCGHSAELEYFERIDEPLHDGQELRCGAMTIRVLHVPGHTVGQAAFLVDGRELYTGDTLFRSSVGSTRHRGHGTCEQLKHSILDVLLRLPPDTLIRPGHMHPSSVGREWDENPFVRMWRGLDAAWDRPCTAFGQPARLLLRAADYDGGTKCWVRFEDSGAEDVLPGSKVQDL